VTREGTTLNYVSSRTSAVAVVALLAFPGVAVDNTVSTVAVNREQAGIYDTWVRIPEQVTRPAPRSQRLVREVRRRTGWSNRYLAHVLGITHPTVRALEEGRSKPNDHVLLERLLEVDAVVERLFILAGQDPNETRRVLETAPSSGRPPASELLRARQPAESYLAALDVIRPPQRTPLMSGFWPSLAGDSTHDLMSAEPA